MVLQITYIEAKYTQTAVCNRSFMRIQTYVVQTLCFMKKKIYHKKLQALNFLYMRDLI